MLRRTVEVEKSQRWWARIGSASEFKEEKQKFGTVKSNNNY